MKIERKQQVARRKDFEQNHEIIKTAFLELLKSSKGRRPTSADLSRQTGLSVKAIDNHLQGLTFEIDPIYKLLNHDVILSVFRTATKGNVGAQKLWFQLQGWAEPSEINVSGELAVDQQPPVIIHVTRRNKVEAIQD